MFYNDCMVMFEVIGRHEAHALQFQRTCHAGSVWVKLPDETRGGVVAHEALECSDAVDELCAKLHL